MPNKEECLTAIDDVARYCSDYRTGMEKPTKELTNELDILNELVEKATPKKPEIKELIRKDNYRDGTNIPRFDWWCPNCHLEHISGNDINYCPTCGQALDWSGEDE